MVAGLIFYQWGKINEEKGYYEINTQIIISRFNEA